MHHSIDGYFKDPHGEICKYDNLNYGFSFRLNNMIKEEGMAASFGGQC